MNNKKNIPSTKNVDNTNRAIPTVQQPLAQPRRNVNLYQIPPNIAHPQSHPLTANHQGMYLPTHPSAYTHPAQILLPSNPPHASALTAAAHAQQPQQNHQQPLQAQQHVARLYGPSQFYVMQQQQQQKQQQQKMSNNKSTKNSNPKKAKSPTQIIGSNEQQDKQHVNNMSTTASESSSCSFPQHTIPTASNSTNINNTSHNNHKSINNKKSMKMDFM